MAKEQNMCHNKIKIKQMNVVVRRSITNPCMHHVASLSAICHGLGIGTVKSKYQLYGGTSII